MRDEYIYDTVELKENYTTGNWDEITHSSICQKKEELKEKYEKIYDSRDKPYYIPWLSMLVNHEQKIGSKVELQLKVEIIDPKWKSAKVQFECPAGIRIVPQTIEVTRKDTIDQDAKGKREQIYTSTKVTVFCDKEHAGEQILIKTVIDKKNPIENIVGKLNIFSSKEYPLNIRFVKFLRKEYLEEDRKFLNDRIEPMISYLKSKSLQQAMIVPEIESKNNEIVISEEEWALDKKLTEIQLSSNKVLAIEHTKYFFREYQDKYETQTITEQCNVYEGYAEYKEILKSDQFKDFDIVYTNGECKDGQKQIKIHKPFEGIVVILTNMTYHMPGVGGLGNFHPTQDNVCLIVKEGLTDKVKFTDIPQDYYPCVSHEIGHVLALDHPFENTLVNFDSKTQYNRAKEKLPIYEKELALDEDEILKYKLKRDANILDKKKWYEGSNNANICQQNADINTENIKICCRNIITYREYIPYYLKIIDSYEWFLNNLNNNYCYFFKKGATDNIMDYYLMRESKFSLFNSFYHLQWELMQKDIAKFHSKIQ